MVILQFYMKFLNDIKKKNLSGDVVLLRVDFNVENFSDALRLRGSVPTILWLLKRKARVVLLSHRGRPHGNGSRDISLSLQSAVPYLSKEIGQSVRFFVDFYF